MQKYTDAFAQEVQEDRRGEPNGRDAHGMCPATVQSASVGMSKYPKFVDLNQPE